MVEWNGMERNGGMVEDLSTMHIIYSISLNCIASHVNNIFGHPSMRGANLMKGLVAHIKAWLVQGVSEVRCRSIPTCSLLWTFG